MSNFEQNITDKVASSLLGKKVSGSDFYDPTLLVAVPRFENRARYGIKNEDLPFEGNDVWHSFEFSVLTEDGLPVTRVLKLKYGCESEFIIESKSLKLYLNSFNMYRLGKSVNEALALAKSLIEKDLSEKLKTRVEVNFLEIGSKREEIFSDYINLMDFIEEKSVNFSKYKEAPDVLRAEQTDKISGYHLRFESLRSNCRVTHQPDFGSSFIYYKSNKHLDEKSLVEYLVSFRSEFHFHEECCEMIFKRLADILNPEDELLVCALYTRRGGINICPARFKNLKTPDKNLEKLFDLSTYCEYGINL